MQRYQHSVDEVPRRRLFCLLGLLVLVLSSCGGVDSHKAPGILRLNLTTAPASLDPAYARDQAMVWCSQQLYEGLLTLDDSLRLQPALASAWQVSDSGRTYTFRIRPGIFFHKHPAFLNDHSDSTRALTAHDFLYSFTRICSPATASPGFWIFSGRIQGLDDFRAGTSATISGFAAPNDSTFVIHLTQPFAPFLTLLTMPYGYAVPQEVVAYHGKDFRKHPVGTGPFRFKHWEEGRSLVLLANGAFREPGLPRVQAIQFLFIADRLTAFYELLRGNLDIVDGLDPALKDDLLTPDGALQPRYAGQIQFYRGPQLTTEYLGFQTDPSLDSTSPWLDPRLRQAVAYAIDRGALVRYLRNGTATPAHAGFVPKGAPGYDAQAVPGYQYNPQLAQQLLAQAGHPGGRGLPPLRLTSSPSQQALNEFLQHQLSQVGLQVQVENQEGAAAREQIYQGRASFWRASWVADYPDAENFLSLFVSQNRAPGGPNTTRYSNALADSLYAAALSAPTDTARAAYYQALERQVLADCPAIYLYYYQIVRLASLRVRHLPTSPMDLYLPLKYVELAE